MSSTVDIGVGEFSTVKTSTEARGTFVCNTFLICHFNKPYWANCCDSFFWTLNIISFWKINHILIWRGFFAVHSAKQYFCCRHWRIIFSAKVHAYVLQARGCKIPNKSRFWWYIIFFDNLKNRTSLHQAKRRGWLRMREWHKP